MSNLHQPVLLQEVLEYLPKSDSRLLKIFDGTFGAGGYTKAFLELGHQVWACDLDPQAVAKYSLADSNLNLVKDNYSNYIGDFADGFFDYIVLDLGFSSNQLESSKRGFSFLKTDEKLDLRYNPSNGQPAYEMLASLKSEKELSQILYRLSGEDFSSRIAKNIFTKKAQISEIQVAEFAELVISAIPQKFRNRNKQVLARVWQALRIWVNQEFENIQDFLHIAPSKLKSNGRLGVVSFHSLEEKLVTKKFRQLAKPQSIDEYGNKIQLYKLLTRKAVLPSQSEIESNPRSRSATLRILEKS